MLRMDQMGGVTHQQFSLCHDSRVYSVKMREEITILRWLQRLEPLAFAAMRAVFGFLFVFHGLQKFGLFGGTRADFATLYGAAGIIETIGGALIMAGLLTTPAAFIASGEMAVAYFRQHQPRGGWPIQNAGELAVLFCFAFLFIATRGGGPWSLDGLRRGGTRKR